MKRIFLLSCLALQTVYAGAQELKKVVYKDGNQVLNGLAPATSAKGKAGVLILPAWMGIDDEAKQAAEALEHEGYAVFVADIYGEGNVPSDFKSAAAIATYYKTNYEAYQHRIQLALEQLLAMGADPDRIAVIGYCFGGTGALETVRGGLSVKGIVSIHGGIGKDAQRPNGAIHASVLIENPDADESLKPEDRVNLVRELNDGKADWQMITYAYCKHTFTNPASPDYNKQMADRAWQHTLLFLKNLLSVR